VARVVPSEIVRVIDRHFPWATGTEEAQRLNANHIGRVMAILGLVDRLPPHLLTLNENEYTDYVAQVEALRSRPQLWLAQPELSRSGQAIREIRTFLTKCPDDSPPDSVHSLSFIADAGLRDDLRKDIDHAERAVDGSEWKAATVLAGSVVEALLLWKLSSFPAAEVLDAAKSAGLKNVKTDLRWWHLPDYIEVAARYPAAKPSVSADTATLLRLVKDFRNLIHPGRSERLAKKCDRSTALTALAGIVAVVNELS
jgi:hypothetical protein